MNYLDMMADINRRERALVEAGIRFRDGEDAFGRPVRVLVQREPVRVEREQEREVQP